MNSESMTYLASCIGYGTGLNSLHAYQVSNVWACPSFTPTTFPGRPGALNFILQGFHGCQGYEYCFEGLGGKVSNGLMCSSDGPTLTNIGSLNRPKDGFSASNWPLGYKNAGHEYQNMQSQGTLGENLGCCPNGYIMMIVSFGMYR